MWVDGCLLLWHRWNVCHCQQKMKQRLSQWKMKVYREIMRCKNLINWPFECKFKQERRNAPDNFLRVPFHLNNDQPAAYHCPLNLLSVGRLATRLKCVGCLFEGLANAVDSGWIEFVNYVSILKWNRQSIGYCFKRNKLSWLINVVILIN